MVPDIDLTADEDDGEPAAQRRRLQEEPHDLLCPIKRVMFRDPVVLCATGHTFERAAIEEWFRRGKRTCPETNVPLASFDMCTNINSRRLVETWLRENPDRTPDGWETREMLPPAHPQPGPARRHAPPMEYYLPDLDVLREWRESCPELRDMWGEDDPNDWGVTWLGGRVTELFQNHIGEISEERLSGPLPRLEGLTSLCAVNLDHNQLSGPIPEKLFEGLTSLREVALFDNQLSGPIPEKLFQGLTSLDTLWLNNNQLSGPIPEKLFEGLTSLGMVSLFGNQLSGPIPEKLFQGLTSLDTLYLDHNQLSGPIPEKLFEGLTSLREVFLHNNQLSGPIPEKLFQGLTSLHTVHLYNNQLTGPIPEKLFEGLTSLKEVSLHDNQLSGPIPESLRAVVKL